MTQGVSKIKARIKSVTGAYQCDETCIKCQTKAMEKQDAR